MKHFYVMISLILFSTPLKADVDKELANKITELVTTMTKDVQDYAKSGQVTEVAKHLTFVNTYEKVCKIPKSNLIPDYPVVTLQDLEDFNTATSCNPKYTSTIITIVNDFEEQLKLTENVCAEFETDDGKAFLQKMKRRILAEFFLFHAMRNSLKSLSEPPTVPKDSFVWVCDAPQ